MTFGNPKRVDVKYDAVTVKSMLTLLEASPFPNRAPIDANKPWNLGMDYEYLKKLRTKFLSEWSWESLESKIAKMDNYMVHYEHEGDALDLHFIHIKSPRSDAIPLILLHGWPYTFFSFHKVIEPLINPASLDLPAFHVVVPSLPGYFMSTLPRRDGWSLTDNAKVFHGLMTSVLGYPRYAGQGGDWGAWVLRIMGTLFSESLYAIHFNMFHVPITSRSDQSTQSEIEVRVMASREEFLSNGFGYNLIQSTKPFTIGIAIASSPLAVLTYIGEKMYSWSDPERIDMQDILDTVALYYLSGSFATSVMIYNQAKELAELTLSANENKWHLKSKFGFSAFPFEIGGSPKHDIASFGPLVYYKEHSSGGHLPFLDSPIELVEDLREFFGVHWATD